MTNFFNKFSFVSEKVIDNLKEDWLHSLCFHSAMAAASVGGLVVGLVGISTLAFVGGMLGCAVLGVAISLVAISIYLFVREWNQIENNMSDSCIPGNDENIELISLSNSQ